MRFWTVSAGASGRVSIVARPLGDELLPLEVQEIIEGGVDVLVSMVAEDEVPILGLDDEALVASVFGLRFFHEPTPDQEPPAADPRVLSVLVELAAAVRSGSHVAVHCRAGHGRSPAFAAGILVAMGFEAGDAMSRLSQARGRQVPHRGRQRDWVRWVATQLGHNAIPGA